MGCFLKSINPWKIQREIKRFFHQLWGLPSRLGSYFFAARYYDMVLSRKVIRTSGSVSISGKVAVYLIYPDLGLQPSHLIGLKYLLSKGYAPVVVSNLPLTVSEREQLLPSCYMCLERPNFGYDFGGYRDGILTIMADMPNMERLLLINDSTWFPLPGCSDWLEKSERLGVGLAAAASNYGIARVDPDNYKDIKWNYVTTHKNFHFCSYALLFSRELLADSGFKRFWKKFPLSNRKDRTVRRGEIGLSHWVLSKGFSYGIPYDVATLQKDLEELDDTRLRTVAENLIVPEDPRLLQVKHEVLAADPSRQELISLVLTCVARQGSSYALADFTINERGFPFLKKSPAWLSREASDITLRLAGALPGSQGATILAEAKGLRATKTQFDEPFGG